MEGNVIQGEVELPFVDPPEGHNPLPLPYVGEDICDSFLLFLPFFHN
jgi:hypothetical protein